MAWVIACAPIIGALAEGIIGEIIGHGESFLFLVSLGINIFLCSADEKSLKKKDVDTSQLGSVFLVPVYLFQRAKLLGDKPGYAILWCILFLAQMAGI